jgi:Polyketide cyclase / dehydrase and lipid transport
MRTDTQTVSIDATAAHVFEFIGEPRNLPRWAAGFARDIRPDGDAWLVTTPQGDIRLRYVRQQELGVIDYHMSPAPGIDVVAYSRVVPAGDGCVYVFTQEQPPGMADGVFESQVRTLARELKLLKSLLEVGSCGT